MYQLVKIHEDATEQVEFIASYKPEHVLETAAEWHKNNLFNWELLDGGQKVAWCSDDGMVGFELAQPSAINPASFVKTLLKI